VSDERLGYRFGPLERRGLLGPVRPGQALTLVLGAALGVTSIDLSPSVGGAVIAAGVAAAAVGVAAIPVAGRAADQWIPVALAFLISGLKGGRRRHTFISPAPTRGMRRTVGQGAPVEPPGQPPGSLTDVGIQAVDYRGRALGILSERRGRRLTMVLACRAASFALLDPDAQERRLSRWGLVLSSVAETSVRRIQWLERTSPARADQLARWLHQARDPAIPPRGTPIVESYLELISGSARVAQDHEILIAIQVDAAGHRERGQPLDEALLEQCERVARGLETADIKVLGALAPSQLGRALRIGFDPFGGAEIAALETVDRDRDGLSAVNAWPLATRENWDRYLCDGAHHATYWIGGWPRVDVSPMFMDAMLGSSDVVRTVSVSFEPISPTRSTREVEAAVTRDRADRELRRRFGQGETARQRQAQEAAVRREAELAAGHAEVRLAGFVTVSGRDENELRRACSQVLEHAARAHLELHRMYGQQADAFTFTLPLARGLR
jgi:hypothetical protein